MTYLIAVLGSFLLLAVFLLYSWMETRTGFRLLGGPRRRLDRLTTRAAFVVQHIDWGAFFAHVVKSTVEQIAHDIVHTTLLTVRATERWLTKTIRLLRERVARRMPEETPVEGSQLVATIVRFRKNFERGRVHKKPFE